MKITSARLGQVDIDPAKILTFPDGIIGFPDLKRYILLPFVDDSPLQLLQAVDEPGLAFVVIDPLVFLAEYRLDLSAEDMAYLKAPDAAGLIVAVIVTIPEDPYKMTANLQGPLVFNPETRLAKQVVNDPGTYPTRHAILADNVEPT
ncbi:MAG: flagellar assembly protein FliW [Nitrospinae bacterium]|nr:flagellar assembly protein FliW [Nitrospinota bacterium]